MKPDYNGYILVHLKSKQLSIQKKKICFLSNIYIYIYIYMYIYIYIYIYINDAASIP